MVNFFNDACDFSGDQNEVTKSSLNKNNLSSKDSVESVNLRGNFLKIARKY